MGHFFVNPLRHQNEPSLTASKVLADLLRCLEYRNQPFQIKIDLLDRVGIQSEAEEFGILDDRPHFLSKSFPCRMRSVPFDMINVNSVPD